MQKIESVESYLKRLPVDTQNLFNGLRKRIKSIVPDSVEGISYNMPVFVYKGKGIAGYAAYKKHWSFFPMSGSIIGDFKDELKNYNTSKGAIQIPYGNTLPDNILKKLILARVKLIDSEQKRSIK